MWFSLPGLLLVCLSSCCVFPAGGGAEPGQLEADSFQEPVSAAGLVFLKVRAAKSVFPDLHLVLWVALRGRLAPREFGPFPPVLAPGWRPMPEG